MTTDKTTRYYVKQLDRKGGAPNWAVYERTETGARAIALCYDESTARRIMRLLARDAEDTGAVAKGDKA